MDKIKSIFESAFEEISVSDDKLTVKNVALVGQISVNNRKYMVEALKNGVGHYEGAKIYIDHPGVTDQKRGFRSVRDLAGKIENARFDGKKIRGDIKLIESEGGKLVYSLATNFPEIAGMSHNAYGKMIRENGIDVIESIEKVVSVDVVTDPATNNGFYESINGDRIMDYANVSKIGLIESRKDLVDQFIEQGKKERDTEVSDLNKKVETLESEKKDLQTKLDELNVKEALAAKEAEIDKVLAESELPKEAKTDLFKETLMRIEVKDGEKLADKVQEHIDDRMLAVSGKKGVKNHTERKGDPGKKIEHTPENVAKTLKGNAGLLGVE